MNILKELRIENGFTHQEMANTLGISKAFYWQLENKKRTLSYMMSIKIANIFNKKPDEVFYTTYKNKEDN